MNRSVLKFVVLPFCVSIIAALIMHYAISRYLVHHAKEQVENILLSNRGFHQYIQKVMHPAFFSAMEQGEVGKSFYDPRVLSSSYIVRTMHGLYNEEREKSGKRTVYYKMAARNPRNPVNKADALEDRLITLFNEDRNRKEYEEIVTVGDTKYLYYAIPFLRNEKRCLKCHGRPEDSPPGLRKLYPAEGGFFEKEGEIRAIESLRVPIGKELYTAFMATGSISSGVFALILLLVFNTGLRRSVKERTQTLEEEIAQRRKAEEQLKASEENFRGLFNQSADAIFIVDEQGEIVDANEVACTRYGYAKQELLSRPIALLYSAEDAGEIPMRISRLKTEELIVFEAVHLSKQGITIPTEVSARHIIRQGKSLFLSTCRDITERKSAEIALKKSENMLQAIIDAEPECVKLLDCNSNLLMMNRAGLSMIEVETLEAVKGCPVTPLVAEDFREQFQELTDRVFRGESGTLLFEAIGVKGTHVWLETHAVPFRNENSEVVALLSITRDVTARRQAEMALAEEKERLAVTLRSIGDGVIVTDMKGCITLLNKVGEELTGWRQEDAISKPLEEVFRIINESTRERCENPVTKVIETGLIAALANHTCLVRPDGSEIVIADSAAPIRDRESRIIGVVLVFRDVTTQHRMEQELQKMEKLESLGILAGGLAHDFNNLLTSVIGNISLATLEMGENHPCTRRLAEAERAARRATDLTAQLLTFAKGGAPIRKAASLPEIVKESIGFALSGSNVTCDCSVPGDLWSTEVDRGQMNQVFNNLIINAIHAMPEGGRVSVAFKNVSIREDDVPSLPAGDYVRVTFRDEGCGISEHDLKRIFEPYFTTKKTGSGLGLATVYSILKRHGGYIAASSQIGSGTTFTIYVPAGRGASEPHQERKDDVHSGQGRILIMDDEPLIREVVGEILSTLGYEPEFAADGAEALRKYAAAAQNNRPFDLVIMDLTIPGGMGGKEAVKKLHEIAPHARVVVSSGYSTDPIMSEYEKYGFCGVMTKPYSAGQVSDVLLRILPKT